MQDYKNERRYLFGCAGKVQHKTMLSAEHSLEVDLLQGQNSEIYECQYCGFLHIGTLWEEKGKNKIKVQKSKYQTKRQRKEMVFNKKKVRRKGR